MTDPIMAAIIGACATVFVGVGSWLFVRHPNKNPSQKTETIEPPIIRQRPTLPDSIRPVSSPRQRRPIAELTHAKILDNIQRVPPFQRDDILKHYREFRVSWLARLGSADMIGDKLHVTVHLKENDLLTFCSARPEDCPGISILHEDTPIQVTGDIDRISKYEAQLINCEITPIPTAEV